MKIPGLSTIWKYLAIAGTFAAMLFFALLNKEKAGRARDKLKVAVRARKTQAKATDALVTGMKEEGEVDDDPNRSHFEN